MAISVFANSHIQGISCTTKIVEKKPKTLEEIYVITDAHIRVDETLSTGKIPIQPQPKEVFTV